MIDWKEIILFVIAVFGCLFGLYQYLRKNTTDNTANDTMVMTELRHIGSDITEMKGDLRTFRTDFQGLNEKVIRLENREDKVESDLATAFDRIDEIREKTEKLDSLDTRVAYLEKKNG